MLFVFIIVVSLHNIYFPELLLVSYSKLFCDVSYNNTENFNLRYVLAHEILIYAVALCLYVYNYFSLPHVDSNSTR